MTKTDIRISVFLFLTQKMSGAKTIRAQVVVCF